MYYMLLKMYIFLSIALYIFLGHTDLKHKVSKKNMRLSLLVTIYNKVNVV